MMNSFLYFFFLGFLLTLAPPCENVPLSDISTTLKVTTEVDGQESEPPTTPAGKVRETTANDKLDLVEVKHDIQDSQPQEEDGEHVIKENDVTTLVPVDKSVEKDIQSGLAENITLNQKEPEVVDEEQNKSATAEEVKIPEEEQSVTEVKIPEEEQSVTEVKIPEEEQSVTEVKIPEEEQSVTEVKIPEEEQSVTEVKIPEEEQSVTEVKIPEEEQSVTEVKIPEEEQSVIEVKIPEEEQSATSGLKPEEEKDVSSGDHATRKEDKVKPTDKPQ
ncbi:uncharacterized protein LOC143239069 [Tachypleus tridentatus]|uniref:uncharacterized protein LOC143239069 n=1 Tax=Tachypleus tridentatus TaxID=6853 RepID=UPI003FD1AB30